MILEVILALILLYVGLNVAFVSYRNYKAHQFFRKKAPGLPVVKNAAFFSGHMNNVTSLHKNWKIMSDLHKEYGKSYGVYYADQPWIATTDIDLLKLVQLDEGYKHTGRYQFHFPIKELNDSIMQSNGDAWRRSRRVIAPALTNSKVRSDEVSEDLNKIVKDLHVSLEKKLAESFERTGKRSIIFNVDDTTQRFALAVILSIGYKQNNVIDFDAEHDEWLKWINEGLSDTSNPIVSLGIMFPFFRPLAHFMSMFRGLGKLRVKVIDFLLKIVEVNRKARKHQNVKQKKLINETDAEDIASSQVTNQEKFKRRLVDTVVDAYLDKKITYDDLVGNMWGIMMAGFITTADALTCLIWQLALHPELQEKLRQTIVEEGIEADYVTWCILETIRWHPPVPLGAGRVLTQDYTVNGQVYPAGSNIVPTTRAIHRDESIWPEADKFKPERWSEREKFHPAAFMGFGLGPRNCPGGKLAIHELKLVLEMLLMNYRFEKCEETTREFDFSSPIFIHNIVDQPIKVRLVTLSN